MTDRRDERPPVGLSAFLSNDLAPAFQTPDIPIEDSRFWPHVPFVLWLIAAARPRGLVELGSGCGVSYAAFCGAAADIGLDARFYAVDCHADEKSFQHFRDFHDRRFAGFSTLKRCAFAEAATGFADGTIDLLHVDDAQDYGSARKTVELWRDKISPRGILLLHGTRSPGVGRLFQELSHRAPHFEFPHGDGLGLVCAGSEAPEPIAGLCAMRAADAEILRARFAFLGARWEERAIAFSLIRQFDDDIVALSPREEQIRRPFLKRMSRSVLKTIDDPLRHFRKRRRPKR